MVYVTVFVNGSDLRLRKKVGIEEFGQRIRTVMDLSNYMLSPDPERAVSTYSSREWEEACSLKQGICNGNFVASDLEVKGRHYPVTDPRREIPPLPVFGDIIKLRLDPYGSL